MNRLKLFAVVFCLVLAFGAFLPAARADEWDRQMEITFSQPVEVPGVCLPAGTYWFVLADSSSNRYIMQIFSQDWSKIYSTSVTIPTIRPEPTDQIVVRLAERPHNQPEALMKLYYPGNLTGYEFVYHHREETELRHDAKLSVTARPMNETYNPVIAPHS